MSFFFLQTNCVVVNSKWFPSPHFSLFVDVYLERINQMFLGKEQAMELTSHSIFTQASYTYNIIRST